MRNRTECSKLCPMLNRFGFCESAMRRAESVKECPHRRVRSGVSPRGHSPAPAGQFTLSQLNTVKK
jgi:hypothetical protein